MSRYASETTVSTEKSRLEIEQILKRYKADAFGYMTDAKGAVIAFRLQGRHMKFVLPLPDPKATEFTHHSRGMRTPTAADQAWEQACRQRWRALALVIKAKLEAVAAGITTIEDEFLAHTVLSDGRTVGEAIQPQIAENYRLGGAPALMLEAPRT